MKIRTFNSRRLLVLGLGSFFYLISSAIYLSVTGDDVSFSLIQVLGFIALIQLVYTLCSWYYVKKNLFDAYVIFTIVLYSFCLSQPILEATGLSVEWRRLWEGEFGITKDEYFSATYSSLIFVLFFHFGAIVSLRRENVLFQNNRNHYFDYDTRALMVSACVFSIISAPFYIYQLIQKFVVVRIFGYAGLYDGELTSPLVRVMGDLFVPSMMVLFCVSLLRNQHVKIVGLLMVILLFLPPFYLGGRSNAMIIAAILFIIYSTIRTINFRKLILIGFMALGLLFIMNLIVLTRNSTERSLENIQAASEKSENPILSTIAEMGWSMYPMALQMRLTPSKKDYSYGSSFYWALIALIPNVGFWDGEHPGKINDPAEILNDYSSENYGIGYSICAGAYNEFGYFGILLMFVYGVIFCSIFSDVSPNKVWTKPIRFVFALLFLWFAIKFVRNSMNSFSRGLIFDVLPIFLLAKFILLSKKRNGYLKSKLQTLGYEVAH